MKKIFGYAFAVCLAAIFMFAPTEQANATKDLKKKHESNKDLAKEVGKIKCDFCHHEIDGKKEGKLPADIKAKGKGKWSKIKKCTECHDPGKEEIKEFDKLPEKLKLIHEKCKKCHEKKEYAQEGDKRRKALPTHLKKTSGCKVCHKG
ncbi:MAG: hypothetical protein OEZ22_02520 [Spirochaetia bacterium]|nr:hypothetical protein [Spirochaetia bacterium]